MKLEEKAKAIIDNYGVVHQLKHFQSEVWELNEAIMVFELGDGDIKHVIEELADVQLMLNEFKEYYEISDMEIDFNMNFKANRQLERIKNNE